MLVRILDSAHNDIRDGYWFYENQEPGVGNYFSDTLYGEIESLVLYAGIHNKRFGFYRALSRRFPYSIYAATFPPELQGYDARECAGWSWRRGFLDT